MKASVVIPTYERPNRLATTVKTVSRQTLDNYEVLIVDDGSSSPKQAAILNDLESEYDFVRVIRQANAGPAAARNQGWNEAKADVILFTDDDCMVPPDWIEQLLSGFEPGIGAVGGPLLPRAEKMGQNAFARLHQYRNEVQYNQPKHPEVGDENLPMGGTANIAYKRESLVEVGGFDEDFPTAAGEDADLQKRVADAGWKMKFVPVVVEHNDSYNWRSFVSRTMRHGEGDYYFARKHGSPRPIWRVLLGLVAAPAYLPIELARSSSPQIASLSVIERAISRYGELCALYKNQ